MSGTSGPGTSPGGQDGGSVPFDRHLVLQQLGGWRGMLDAAVPTVAFIVANSVAGLRTGIYAALGAALVVFLLRAIRRESLQQAFGGLFGVAIAVAIAANSGEARDFFVLGIVRNAAIGMLLLGSVALRRPLIGVAAEFLAPSHLGSMAALNLPGLRRNPLVPPAAAARSAGKDPEPERHWRDDPVALRAYGRLTGLWAATFLLRVVVQAPLYYADEVELLGTVSLVLGLPLTAVVGLRTVVVLSRLHRIRSASAGGAGAPTPEDAGDGGNPVADAELRGPPR